ncbi:MAG: type II toxin-antitoxin system HicA family toxin [Desulfobacterium sp.]|nr:type II toxin-antitoxin system HicA family toxin [Desulfobacterium sp.]
MSEKMPVVSGKALIRFLESLGYEVARQRGSHVRLVKSTMAGNHKISIPNHNPVAKGTLSDILSKVSIWCQINKQDLAARLKKY